MSPITNGKPVQVKINILFNDMMPVTERDMHFTLDFYLRMEWSDHRLKFQAYNTSVFIPFESHFAQMIWTPSLYFPNGKKGFRHPLTKPNVFVKVHSDGRVFYSERLSLVSFCQMNLTYFPFDIQMCNLTMEDYSNPIEYLRLQWHPPPWQQQRALRSRVFEEVTLEESRTTRVGDFGQRFDKLIIKFTLYRDLELYLLRDFLPTILIVTMSWISFWICYKAIPARVCLGITTVLATVSMTNRVNRTNPSQGSLRSIDVFLLVCLLFVFGALLELAVTGMVHHRGAKWWKKKLKNGGEDADKDDDVYIDDVTTGLAKPGKKCFQLKRKLTFMFPFVFLHDEETHIVDEYAKVVFPTLFVLFIFLFLLFHHVHPQTAGHHHHAKD